jgi:acyl carrier protein
MPDALTQDVIAIIAREQHIPAERIRPDSSFEELKIDSLDGVNLVFAFEEHYNLTIPDETARTLTGVDQVITLLRRQLAAVAPAADSA